MFARLYLGIVTGMSTTIFLFLHLGEGHMRRTEIETFLNDGLYFVEQYIQHRDKEDSLYKELDRTGHQQFFIFNLRLLENWSGEPPCQRCELHTILNGVPIYLNENNWYSAVYQLPNSKFSYAFCEVGDFFSPEIEWYEDSERHFLLGLLLAVIIAIGASVYLPVRGFQDKIESLVEK